MGTLAVFGALGLARFGYSMVLPAMQGDLGLTNAQAGLLATANLAGYLVLSAIGGALAARYGARLVTTAGLALAGLGMLLTGLARGLIPAAVWRCLTGLGSGAANIAVMGLWAAWFVTRRRGLASGIAVAGSSLALILTGLFVPHLLSIHGQGGWRACWFAFGGMTLVLGAGAYLVLRNKPVEKGLAPIGAIGAESAPERGSQAESLGWRGVYRAAPVWHLGLLYIAFGFSYIIYMTFFAKRLVADAGYTPAAAGRLLMAVGWVSIACGLIWGTVSDAIGRRRTLAIVYLIQAAAFSLFALCPTQLGFSLSAVLFGLTAWSIPAIMAAACGDIMSPRMAPAALGFITLFFGIGQAIGPSVAGAIADAAGSFAPAFLLAGGVALLGALGAAALGTRDGARGNECK